MSPWKTTPLGGPWTVVVGRQLTDGRKFLATCHHFNRLRRYRALRATPPVRASRTSQTASPMDGFYLGSTPWLVSHQPKSDAVSGLKPQLLGKVKDDLYRPWARSNDSNLHLWG